MMELDQGQKRENENESDAESDSQGEEDNQSVGSSSSSSSSLSERSDDWLEQATEEGESTWIYMEDAAEKVFVYIDKVAEKTIFSSKGMGLTNMSIRKAWNRCDKLQEAVKARQIDKMLQHISTLREQLSDKRFLMDDQSLVNDVESILKGVSYIENEAKKFNKFLLKLPEDVRVKICTPESEDIDSTEKQQKEAQQKQEIRSRALSSGKVGNGSNRVSVGPPILALTSRFLLDLKLAKIILLKKMQKYGCLLQSGDRNGIEIRIEDGAAPRVGSNLYNLNPARDVETFEERMRQEKSYLQGKIYYPNAQPRGKEESKWGALREARTQVAYDKIAGPQECEKVREVERERVKERAKVLGKESVESCFDPRFREYQLGLIAEATLDLDSAKDHFQQASIENSSLASCCSYRMGRVLHIANNNNNNNKALQAFEQASTANPELDGHQEVLASVLGEALLLRTMGHSKQSRQAVERARVLTAIKGTFDHDLIERQLDLLEQLLVLQEEPSSSS